MDSNGNPLHEEDEAVVTRCRAVSALGHVLLDEVGIDAVSGERYAQALKKLGAETREDMLECVDEDMLKENGFKPFHIKKVRGRLLLSPRADVQLNVEY